MRAGRPTDSAIGFRLTELAGKFWIWVIVLAGFKLILISGNEIIPEGSDSVLYFEYAYKGFWDWPSLPMRGPVYPLWIALSAALHIPFRLSSELLFIASAACFAATLKRLGVTPWVRTVVYAVLILHPASLYMLDQPMSEAFFSALLIFWLASGICVLTTDKLSIRLTHSGVFGLLASALLDTRGNDAVLIYSFCGGLLLAVVFGSWAKRSLRERLLPVGTALTVMVFSSIGILAANYAAFGVFRSNEIVTVGQKKLMHALMSIDPEENSPHKYIGVTSRARQIAYRLSPTLAGFEAEIERFVARDSQTAFGSFSRTHVPGELDNIETLDVIDRIIKRPTVDGRSGMADQEALQSQIAKEIKSGIASGRAKGRFVIYMWDPLSPTLYRKAAGAFRRLVVGLAHVNTAPVIDNYPFYGSLFSPIYNLMGTRRVSLVEKGPLTGFVAVPKDDDVLSVTLLNNSVPFFSSMGAPDHLDQFLHFMQAENLPLYDNMGSVDTSPVPTGQIPFHWNGGPPDGVSYYSFSIPPVLDRFNLYFGALKIRTRQAGQFVCDELVLGSFLPALASSQAGVRGCFLTSFPLRLDPAQTVAYTVQNGMWSCFNRVAPAAALLLLIFTAWSVLSRSINHRWTGVWLGKADYLIVVLLLWLLVGERLVFYAFLDASIVPLNDDRHLFAANILFFPALILSANAVAQRRRT